MADAFLWGPDFWSVGTVCDSAEKKFYCRQIDENDKTEGTFFEKKNVLFQQSVSGGRRILQKINRKEQEAQDA